MNTFFKLLLIFLCISAMPLVLTVLLWCLTIGSFGLIETLHHGLFITITAMMMFMGFVTCGMVTDEKK